MEENLKVMKMNELKAQIRFLTSDNHFRYPGSDDQCLLVAQPLMHCEHRHRGNLSKPERRVCGGSSVWRWNHWFTCSHVSFLPLLWNSPWMWPGLPAPSIFNFHLSDRELRVPLDVSPRNKFSLFPDAVSSDEHELSREAFKWCIKPGCCTSETTVHSAPLRFFVHFICW